VVLRHGTRERLVPLDRFYLGYQKSELQPGEVLVSLRIPALPPGALFRAWKVSKRRDQDISAVCGAFVLTVEGGRVIAARVAYGGLAATARRAPLVEAALSGHAIDLQTLHAARAALAEEFRPLTDGRASDAYRSAVAANLLTRLWDELAPAGPR
jgi:xanthine dehydrogenase small subunit